MGVSAPDAPATEGWTRDAPVEEWRAYVRAAYASNPGQCPLDVNVDNIYSFNQGSMSFIEQDLRVLPEAMARQALDAARRASVSVVHNGDLIRRVEDLRARALLALSEEQEQPTTRPRSESLLARGLEGLGV